MEYKKNVLMCVLGMVGAVACRGGWTRWWPRAAKARGHRKSEITKIKMLWL